MAADQIIVYTLIAIAIVALIAVSRSSGGTKK